MPTPAIASRSSRTSRNTATRTAVAAPAPSGSGVDLSAWKGKYPPAVLENLEKIFVRDPGQARSFKEERGGNLDQYLDAMTQWWGANAHTVASKRDEFAPELAVLDALGYEIDWDTAEKYNPEPAQTPVEEELFKRIYDDYILPDLEADQTRRREAQELIDSYRPALDANRQLINDLTTVDEKGNTAIYNRTLAEDAAAVLAQNDAVTAQQRASEEGIRKYEEALGSAIGARETADISALQTQLDQLKGNLDAELASRAESIQTQLAALQAGIGRYTDAERAALQQRLSEEFAALETEVATKRQALETELASKGAAITEQDAARKQALEAELATLGNAVTAQEQARVAAINSELATLDQAVGARDAARREALTTELSKLTQAQQQVNATRIRGAEALSGAINLASQAERDRITANMARQGYVGSDTGTDNALFRASLGAQQNAALAMADAQNLNAADDMGLARYGAGEERGIGDQTAQSRFDLSGYGAGELRGAADEATTARYNLSGYGAGELRGINDATAQGRSALSFYGADENRSLSDYGATQRRGISQFGAESNQGISSNDAQMRYDTDVFGATENRSLSDYGATQRRTQGDFGANQRRDIATRTSGDKWALAGEVADRNWAINQSANADRREIADAAARRKASYFSEDLQRRLAGLGLPAANIQQDLQFKTAVDEYGQSGLRRTMGNLDWFKIGTSQAPGATSPGYTTNDVWGTGLQNVGAGIANLGLEGAINKWAPKTPAVVEQPKVPSFSW